MSTEQPTAASAAHHDVTLHVSTEIASQPDVWQRAAQHARDEAARAVLPQPGERVAIVGCGTSYYIAQACAAARENAGHGITDAFAASEFPPRTYDRVVVISRSGTTTEALDVLASLRNSALPSATVAVTADPNSPIVGAADAAVVLDYAEEQSVVQTRFATTALALWRAALGEDLSSVITDAREAARTPLPHRLMQSSQFTFLGTGFAVGIAHEAALKVREASQSWAESYPSMEFRHGPISVVDARSTVWIFGAVPAGLIEDVARTGAHVEHADVDPMADLVRVQRLAVEIARCKGLDADHPRHLTRSIVLTG